MVQDRTYWSLTYLYHAELLERPERGKYQINTAGLSILKNQKNITIEDLKKSSKFASFIKGNAVTQASSSSKQQIVESALTPTEIIDNNFITLNNELADDILQKILSQSPAFFEKLVVDLLLKMGYGNENDEDSFVVTQRSNDKGIDGIIKEDKLGLDKIYVQAKRWSTAQVAGPDIDSFIGAMSNVGAAKGVYITTSTFSQPALTRNQNPNIKIVLIDGKKLCKYMIEYGLGVSVTKTYEIKRIDSDYFEE